MAGQWKHGWIPISPGAVASKNHGHKPGGSKSSKAPAKPPAKKPTKPAAKKPSKGKADLTGLSLDELSTHHGTPAWRKEIMRRQRESENAKAIIPRGAAAAAGFQGGRKPYRKKSLKGRR